MVLYTAEEAGIELMLSRSTILRMARAGEIPHHRIGGLIRFTPEDLAAYLEAAAVPMRIRNEPTKKELRIIEAADSLGVEIDV